MVSTSRPSRSRPNLQAVQGREHGIDCGRGVVLGHKVGFSLRGRLLTDVTTVKSAGKFSDISEIFLHGCAALFLHLISEDDGRMLGFVVALMDDFS